MRTTEANESIAEMGSEQNYADERTTNRRGVATKFYNRDSEHDQVETIWAAYNFNPGDGEADGDGTGTDMTFDDTGETVMTTHYWAEEAGNNDDLTIAITVVVIDKDANSVVVSSGAAVVWLVKYDSNDQFTTSSVAGTMSAFEGALRLADPDRPRSTLHERSASTLIAVLAADADGVSTLTTNTPAPAASACA